MAPYLFDPSSDDDSDPTAYPIFSLPAERQKRGSRSNCTSRDKRQEYENAARHEFGDGIHEANYGWARELYRDLATDDEISTYLQSSHSGYDTWQRVWTPLSLSLQPDDRSESLRAAITSIVSNTWCRGRCPKGTAVRVFTWEGGEA